MKLEIHASKLDQAADCPRMAAASMYPGIFKQAGLDVFKTTTWVSAPVGSAIHAGVEFLHHHWINNKQIAGKGQVPEAVATANSYLQAELIKNPDIVWTKKFPDITAATEHMADYIQFYKNTILPKRPAKLVELRFDTPITADAKIVSAIDLYTEKHQLCDLKTGAKITPAWHQLGTYVYLLRHAGETVKESLLDYILRNKDNTLGHKEIAYSPDAAMELALRQMTTVIKDWEAWEKTNDIRVFAINPRSASCNQIFCPLWGGNACPGWRDKV